MTHARDPITFGFEPTRRPVRRHRASSAFVVLVVLLVASALTGAAAWYLLLTPRAHVSTPVRSVLALQRTSAAAQLAFHPGPLADAGIAVEEASLASSPSPGTPSASPSIGPSASIDPQVIAQIDAVVAQVPDIRQLQPKADVPYRFITRDEYAIEAQQQFNEDNPPERVAASSDLYQRLGLLAPGTDLGQEYVDLLTSQVAAFYDPKTKTFTVIQEPDHVFNADDKITVAHEYTHALQDQYFDLNKLQDIPVDQSDRQTAVTALAEGDATDVMYEWAFTHLSPEELASLGTSVTPENQQALDAAPMLLRQSLQFPYFTGLTFITTLQASGGWDTVNQAWGNPPVSTEQIMHPEKYAAGEKPIDVQLPKLEDTLGEGWTQSISEVEGEFFTGVWVANGEEGDGGLLGLPGPLPNAEAAAGWGGDRIASFDGPDGAWAVVWQTAWDTATDADEFVAAASPVLSGLSGAASATVKASVAGDIANPVLVLIASDQPTLNKLKLSIPSG